MLHHSSIKQTSTGSWATAVMDLTTLFGEGCKGFESFGFEKPLNTQNLMSFCGDMEDKAESNGNVKFQKEV